VVLVWLVLFMALLFFELHHMAFYALFGAVGAFAAGIVALLAPDAIALQLMVSLVVAFAGVILIRPYVSRVFHQHRGGHVAIGVHGGLVGQQAVTLDEIGDIHQVGHVRLAGERWLATTDGPKIGPGRTVVVTALQGTTLQVWPADLKSLDAPDGVDRSNS
jgi:membrane protein implicated in regulation of membrane protease activity